MSSILVQDALTARYADLLDGTYDCVDRIVVNAFFRLGSTAGGFRTWWRRFLGDDKLDETHLMRFAGRFSRRLRGWARKNGIPVVDCKRGERKHLLAAEYLPEDPEAVGTFVVFVSRAPAPVWRILRFASGKFKLVRPKSLPYVNHFSFHIMDPDWGHVTIKISSHPPFGAQIILNGHEYVARQAAKEGLEFTKEGNCFTLVSNAADLLRVADTVRSPNVVGRLRQVCERWIYSCLAFGLDLAEQKSSGFSYEYSVYQLEYSRNLLFSRGAQMESTLNSLIDRGRSLLDIKTIKTLFGRKQRPRRRRKGPQPRVEVCVNSPRYSLTIFKINFGRLTLKIYTKGQAVLRIEAVAHNTKDLRCGRMLPRFELLVENLSALVDRFMDWLSLVDSPWIDVSTLDDLGKPARIGKIRVGGVDINKPLMRPIMEAVCALACAPFGFTVNQLAAKVAEISGQVIQPRQVSYRLLKLRAKNFVQKIGTSHRYLPTAHGLKTIAALVLLHDRVLRPLLANDAQDAQSSAQPHHPIDDHYRRLRHELSKLLEALHFQAPVPTPALAS